ncbi:GlsB/YeaQ/YmgE family stress response membrane protein [Rhodanobacter sp. A1T4]|uniref:GlsB/YeaQ/YmgE family stress response membrane protein n=1 Tax=Rhodanobacter sp. A1T4 TaxID=2723087 RepID=UPI00160C0628|nr:GlsB/YeaQ/YmgE family stress response membrane protein [Rhodanobacter sp. A1T4]MBB6246476.1 putative membrane protein YeaQ/YmgE (transglycosylase-associated protein family) [Rhodanobacter sp. A1T4]
MASHGIFAWLIIGALAGWLAGKLVKGSGFGLLVDILLGIVGAFIGGWLTAALGIGFSGGLLASIIMATFGAIILLFAVRLFKAQRL